MKLPTGKKMSEIDKETSQTYSFPSLLLMENAGRGITDALLQDFPEIAHQPPVILAGGGNNGGDAFVIARQLFFRGICSIVVFAGKEDKLKGDARINYDLHRSLNLPEKGVPVISVALPEEWDDVREIVFGAQYLIDGLFGTGFEGKPEGIYREIIESVNQDYHGIVLAIDVPSGLICDAVMQNDCILRAEKTYTIGLPKLGMQDYPGKDYTGDVEIIHIGFPQELLESETICTEIITLEDAAKLKPLRMPHSHKGDYGHVCVIAGSAHYPGAAHLASLAAFRSGAGLVTLASTDKVCQSIKSGDNEIIFFPFHTVTIENGSLKEDALQKKEIGLECITAEHFHQLQPFLNNYSVCLMGPGMGNAAETLEFVKVFIEQYKGNLILDASALDVLQKYPDILKNLKKTPVITPHIGEFARLTGKSIENIKNNKLQYALHFAQDNHVILVLKDAVTLVTDGETAYFNTTGNAGLARGGSGDVLAGIIAAMVARKLPPLQAALFSVFLHGYIADILCEEYCEEGIYPSLIIDNIYKGFLAL